MPPAARCGRRDGRRRRDFRAATFAAPAASTASRAWSPCSSPTTGCTERRRPQPPARRLDPARLLPPGVHLRGAGLALAAAPDRGVPRAPRGAWARATSRRKVPTAGRDEFAALGERVQQDVRAARAAAGGARARAPARCSWRCAASARRSPPTSTATRCWRSSCARRSTASARPAAARCMRPRPTRRSTTSRSAGARGGLDRHASSASRGRGARVRASRRRSTPATATRSPTRCAAGPATERRRASSARRRLAQRAAPFTDRERELFHYLAGQAAVSVENVGLHETVERQAVTDELTGLSNRRRFQETLAAEVERSRRFGQPVGLVMLDIDDFKAVNDTYGHQQGDLVLREVARVLRDVLARDRRARALRRRGARRRPARAPTCRAPTTWPSACASASRRWRCRCSATRTASRCRSRRASAPRPSRPRPPTCAGSSRRPTRRCTRPSARARTAPSRGRG